MGEGEYVVRITRVAATGARVNVLPANPKRVTLTVSSPGILASGFAVATGWPDAEARFPVPSTGFLIFEYAKHGPLVAGAWSLDDVAMGPVYAFVEVLLLKG